MNSTEKTASPFRLTIRSLFLWTAILALSFGALLFANEWWLAALSLLVGLAATWAAIVAVVERGVRRAFAVGVLAWILMQAFVLPELLGTGSRLPSTRLMEAIYPLVAGPELVDYRSPAAVQRWRQSRGRFQQEYFIPVGDLLCTLLLSGACGLLGQFVYGGRVRDDRVATKVVE
jgi:CDP-diglyceride synthetase